MKKLFTGLTMILIFATLIIPALAEDIVVKINDVPVAFDVNPIIVEGRTMVPLRAIFVALDAQVTWDGETNTIYGSKGSTIIILQIANKKAFINSKEVDLDVAPQIVDGRTLVPTRFIAEALTANVKWDAETSTVMITTNSTQPAPTATPVVDEVKTFNATTLATYNGKNGNPAYIAVNGNVYDVTNSSRWAGGTHKGYPAGVDYTNQITQAHNLSILDGLTIVGKYSN